MSDQKNPQPLADRAVRALLGINAVLLALLYGYVIYVQGTAPERYVVHHTTTGRPDRWVLNDGGAWYVLPLFATVFGGLLVAFALLEPRLRLHRFGMQQRAKFAALPQPQQWPLVRSVVLFILAIAAIDTLVLAAVQVSIYGTGQTLPQIPAEWVVGVAIALYPLVGLPWLLVLRGHLTRALAGSPKS